MAVEEREFESMRYRARSFRKRVDELGGLNVPAIEENVRARMLSQERDPLPPAQGELADEIVALLGDTGLSPGQARELYQEFFGI